MHAVGIHWYNNNNKQQQPKQQQQQRQQKQASKQQQKLPVWLGAIAASILLAVALSFFQETFNMKLFIINSILINILITLFMINQYLII